MMMDLSKAIIEVHLSVSQAAVSYCFVRETKGDISPIFNSFPSCDAFGDSDLSFASTGQSLIVWP